MGDRDRRRRWEASPLSELRDRPDLLPAEAALWGYHEDLAWMEVHRERYDEVEARVTQPPVAHYGVSPVVQQARPDPTARRAGALIAVTEEYVRRRLRTDAVRLALDDVLPRSGRAVDAEVLRRYYWDRWTVDGIASEMHVGRHQVWEARVRGLETVLRLLRGAAEAVSA